MCGGYGAEPARSAGRPVGAAGRPQREDPGDAGGRGGEQGGACCGSERRPPVRAHGGCCAERVRARERYCAPECVSAVARGSGAACVRGGERRRPGAGRSGGALRVSAGPRGVHRGSGVVSWVSVCTRREDEDRQFLCVHPLPGSGCAR